MEGGRTAFRILKGKSTGKRSNDNLSVDGRKILELILRKIYVNTRKNLFGSAYGLI